MRLLTAILALGMVLGCGKSKCEKYAEMEIRCGGFPKSEEDITRKLAEGFCEAGDSDDPEGRAVGKDNAAAAACAVKFLDSQGADCGGYKQCKAALK